MSRIKKGEWTFVFAIAGAIDIIQWVLDLTGVGAGLNELADPFIGLAAASYFQIRGVSMISRPSRLASLVGAVLLEEVSVSIAPAWIFDVWYIHRSVKQEMAEIETAQAQAEATAPGGRQPLNENEVRLPRPEKESRIAPPPNVDGVRRPGVVK